MKPIAMITGATGGIGSGIAALFAGRGYDLILHTRRHKAQLEAFQEAHPETQVWILEADLREKKTLLPKTEALLQEIPHVDVFIHNAGLKIDGPVDQFAMEDFEAVMDVSVHGMIPLLKAVVPKLKKQKSGRIIAISSGIGYQGRADNVPYATAKSALNGLISSLAKELGPYNITVNAVAPGLIPTEMTAYYDDAQVETYRQSVPLKRLATPLDIAKACFFFASSEADFISGQTLFVNGGTLTH